MNRNLTVGLVVAAATAILFMAILMVGQEQALFTPRNTYLVLLPNAEGLQLGSPVKLVGVQVGVVTEIRLPAESEEQSIRVTLSVNRAFADRIRIDTHANIRLRSLLSGEKYIELTLGSPEKPELPPGSTIFAPVSDFEQIFAQGTNIATDMAEITSALRVIFDSIQRKEGLIGQLLIDPEFGQESVQDVQATLNSVRVILEQIETGQGLLGAAIGDGDLRQKVTDDLGGLFANLNTILESAQDPGTPLGSLLHKAEDGDSAMENLRQASESVRRVTERLESGEGLMGRLLNDPQYADRVLGDLETTLSNLASITGKIDRGEGTLGGFVNDPALYQGVRDVVIGVQESRMLRWIVDRYARRGTDVLSGGQDTSGSD